MGDVPRYGRAKLSTVLRDINNLRTAIRSHDSEATEAAWEKCERWMGLVAGLSAKDIRDDRHSKTDPGSCRHDRPDHARE
jgi:hypothetical protein